MASNRQYKEDALSGSHANNLTNHHFEENQKKSEKNHGILLSSSLNEIRISNNSLHAGYFFKLL